MTVLDDATGKPLTGVVSVQDDAATGAACAALTDGTVKCWLVRAGMDAVGQLGNGSTAATSTLFRATPVVTTGGAPLTHIRAMGVGDFGGGNCALTNDGRAYCWGDLTWIAGDGVTTLHTGVAQLLTIDGTNPLTGVIQVAVGNRQACVLREGTSGNEVWCWGYAGHGELGQGNTTNLVHPTKVPGLTNPSAIAITVASDSSAGRFADATVCVVEGGHEVGHEGGDVRCWGSNSGGAAGINSPAKTILIVPSPMAVVDANGVPLGGVIDLAPGFSSFSALRSDGSLWLWGNLQQPYAGSFATGVIAIGYGADTGGFGPFYLTSDGALHNGTFTVPCSSI